MANIIGTIANETFLLINGDFTTTNGDDIITPQGGEDVVEAGEGNDIIKVQGSQVLEDDIDGEDGIDTLENTSSSQALQIKNINYTSGIGNVISIEIIVGKGNNGNSGRKLHGTNEINNFNLSGVDLTNISEINLQDGDDTLNLNGVNLTDSSTLSILGGSGSDVITGSDDLDEIITGGGTGSDLNDIDAGGGDDVINAGASQDIVDAGAGNDTIKAKNDQLLNDQIDGGDGIDTLENTSSSQALQINNINDQSGTGNVVNIETIVGKGSNGNSGRKLHGTNEINNFNLAGVSLNNISEINLKDGDDIVSTASSHNLIRTEYDGGNHIISGDTIQVNLTQVELDTVSSNGDLDTLKDYLLDPTNKTLDILSLNFTATNFENASLRVDGVEVDPQNLGIGNLYYFDSNASNGGDGSMENPWNNFAELDSITLNPSDRILLKRGSTFYEKLQINASGDLNNPIVVSSYGDQLQPDPVISGGQQLDASGWQEVLDGSGIGTGEYRNELGSSLDFSSVPVLVRSDAQGNNYQLLEIGGSLGSLEEDRYITRNESGTRVVYYRPPVNINPDTFNFEVERRNAAIEVNGDWVTVENINGRVSKDTIFTSNGDNTLFDNLSASFAKGFGISIQGASGTINNSTAQYNYSTGIVLLTSGSVNGTISNNISRFNGNLILAGRTDRGGIGSQSDNSTIINNLIYSNGDINSINLENGSGDDAIALFDNNNALVANNYIFNSAGTAIGMSYTDNSYGHTIVDNVIGNWNLYGIGEPDKALIYQSPTARGTYAIGITGNDLQANEADIIVENNTIFSNQTSRTLIGIQAAMVQNDDWMGDTSIQNNDIYIPDNTNANTIGLRLTRDIQTGFQNVTIDNNNVFVNDLNELDENNNSVIVPRTYYSWRTDFSNVQTAAELSAEEIIFNAGTENELTSVFEANGTNNPSSEFLFGNEASETITGTSSSEYLIGFSGDDTLTGLGGNDTFVGGEGNDQFIFAAGSGNDIITDFQVGEDSLVLEGGLTITGITEETYDNTYYQRIDTIVTFSSGDQVTLYNVADIVDSSQLT